MRKLIFVLLGLFSFSSVAFAKSGEEYSKHEIYASIGLMPQKDLLPESTPYFSMINVPFDFENKKYSNMVTFGYMLNLSKKFAFGIAYSNCEMQSDLRVHAAEQRTAYVSAKYNVWMLNAKYLWLRLGGLSLYSRAGIGSVKMKAEEPVYDNVNDIGMITGWKNKNDIAWHIAPLGIQYTFFKHLGVFAEGGIGVESCVVGGLKIIL